MRIRTLPFFPLPFFSFSSRRRPISASTPPGEDIEQPKTTPIPCRRRHGLVLSPSFLFFLPSFFTCIYAVPSAQPRKTCVKASAARDPSLSPLPLFACFLRLTGTSRRTRRGQAVGVFYFFPFLFFFPRSGQVEVETATVGLPLSLRPGPEYKSHGKKAKHARSLPLLFFLLQPVPTPDGTSTEVSGPGAPPFFFLCC